MKSNKNGFTILELMIATTVLSVILLLATSVMIAIGNLYYKGNAVAQIQDAVRTSSDFVTQDLQFSAGGSANPESLNTTGTIHLDGAGYLGVRVQAYCIGAIRYSFLVNTNNLQLGGINPPSTIPHMLWRDSIVSGGVCAPLNLSHIDPGGTNGQELVPSGARLANFSITSDAFGFYTVQLGMVFGDPTLSASGNCANGPGDRFCATDNLTTKVTVRTP